MSLSKHTYYQAECDNKYCCDFQDIHLSDRKEAIQELKDTEWIFSKGKTYCCKECKEQQT